MTIEIGFICDVHPPRVHPISSKKVPASIEFILDFDIPEIVWEKYKDDEDELIEWAIKYILVPGFTKYSEKCDPNFDANEN